MREEHILHKLQASQSAGMQLGILCHPCRPDETQQHTQCLTTLLLQQQQLFTSKSLNNPNWRL